jgi:hypothetical protein
MSTENNADEHSGASGNLSDMWLHPNGNWAKKKEGRVFYFGRQREEAERRFALWQQTGLCGKELRRFVNAWLTDNLGSISFDKWFASYELAGWLVRHRGPFSGIEACEEFLRLQPTALDSWDTINRVYFVSDGELVKIGISRRMGSRLSALQTANGRSLEMVLEVPGGREYECKLHHRFGEYRAAGEWFKIVGDLKSWLDQIREAWWLARRV